MNESEQAQAIHEIDSRLNNPWGHDTGHFINDCEYLRDLVDSQAQKIAEQEKEIERLKQRNLLAQDVIDCAMGMNSVTKMLGKGPIDPNIDYFAKQLSDFDSEKK